ncbi:MAG TPA: helix-turn-helix domain-containing protein [Micromonosporaceae bacterium]
MPKINAATVVEHRAQQRTALLDAARELLLDGGYAALTFSALAEATGLARPSIYAYFAAKDDIAVALSEVELPLVAAEIDKAVQRATGPRERVVAYIRAQLRAAQQRPYRIAHALATAPLAAQTRQRIVELHRVMPSAVPLLEQLGHPHPALGADLLQGMINTAVAAIDAGQPPRRVAQVTVAAALDGLAAGLPGHR